MIPKNLDRRKRVSPEVIFKRTISFLKNPIICKSILLMFLNGFAPQSPQAKFYYYTNALKFDPSFMGSLNFIGIAAILIAIGIYDRYLKGIDIKKFYTGTLLIACVLSLSQLILVFRWNVQAWHLRSISLLLLIHL